MLLQPDTHIKLLANHLLSFVCVFSIEPYPATPLILHYFCAELSQKLSYKTIKVYLSAIRFEHLERGLPDPTNNKLLHNYALQGHKMPPRRYVAPDYAYPLQLILCTC